jgi:hypothetical protein
VRLDEVILIEHMAAKSTLSLEHFCLAVQNTLSLPDFEYEIGKETEWGISFKDGVEYNVSFAYDVATLRNWDSTVPEGFNFTLALIFRKTTIVPLSASVELVLKIGQLLAVALGVPVAHHRTWVGVGNNVPRNCLFLPDQAMIKPSNKRSST